MSPRALTDADKVIKRSALICAAGLGGFLLWAGFAPLEEGVAAQGAIVAAGDRQAVQHLEGGIVDALLVKEGDAVKEGQPLVILRRTASESERDRILYQIATLEGSIARLAAIQDDAEAPDFGRVNALAAPPALIARVVKEQEALFLQSLSAFENEVAILTTRASSARATSKARGEQAKASRGALASARKQLALTREMFEGRIARLEQVQSLEQQVAGLEADVVRLENEQAEALANAVDQSSQIERARITRRQTAAEDMLEARVELTDRQEALMAAEDILSRTEILAPHDGEVLNLLVKTVGGVVRPSDTIMEIIPDSGALVASLRIRPIDRASIYKGQKVRTRLAAYKSWKTPQITGEVESVSADLKSDKTTGEDYYEARIRVSDIEAKRLGEVSLTPGMPVEAFVFSGSSRTLLDYILQPISESLFRGVRAS
jgi:HlyD family type I secretion membrane fusion protein